MTEQIIHHLIKIAQAHDEYVPDVVKWTMDNSELIDAYNDTKYSVLESAQNLWAVYNREV